MPFFSRRPESKGSRNSSSKASSSNACKSPRSLAMAKDADNSDVESPVGVKVMNGDTEMTALAPSFQAPDNMFLRALRWLLLNEAVFPAGHDVTSESSYLRMRGAHKWNWLSDASFRAVHEAVAEAVEFSEEPLGTLRTTFVWFVILVAMLVAILGAAFGRNRACSIAIMLPAPLYIVAFMHVWRARRCASVQMARCAFERERAKRMSARPPFGREPDVVVHHVVLSFLEDVLEFCKYGELPGGGVPHQWGWGDRTASICPHAAAAEGLRGNPDCTRSAFEHMHCYKCNNCSLWFGMHAFTRWCTVDGPLESLRHANEYVNENVGVSMFKYDWQTDAALRLAAVAKAEWKLCLSARVGARSRAVIFAGMLPAVLLLAGSIALIATGYIFVYIPAIVTASAFFVVSFLLLWRRLPVWKIVDGLIEEAYGRLESGERGVEDIDEITQITDVAIRALDFSLMAMNDQGEQQSCEYWPIVSSHIKEDGYKVFEGLDAASLTPSQRHQSLRQQISVQLQYASAERHRFIRQNSPLKNMNVHTNALAYTPQDAPFSPISIDNSIIHARGQHNRAHSMGNPSRTSPPESPQPAAQQAAQEIVVPQHAARSIAYQRRQASGSEVPHHLGNAYVHEPSLFDLPSEPSASYERQSSGLQSLPSTALASSAGMQQAAPKWGANMLQGAGATDQAANHLAAAVHVPLLPVPRSKSLKDTRHAPISTLSATKEISDNIDNENTAAFPGVAPASMQTPVLGAETLGKGKEEIDPIFPNPVLPISAPNDGTSRSGTTFLTAMGTPGASFASANEATPTAASNSFSGAGSSMQHPLTPSSPPKVNPFLSKSGPKGHTGSSTGAGAATAHSASTGTALLSAAALAAATGDSAALSSSAWLHESDVRMVDAEMAGGYSAGESEFARDSHILQAHSSAMDSAVAPSLGLPPKGPAAPPINFANKPALGAYAAAPFNVMPMADADYSSSHVAALSPEASYACPASAASTGGVLPVGAHLVVGGGGVGRGGLPAPFSAASESTRMTPAAMIQLLDLSDL